MLTTEMVIGMTIIATVMLPIAFAFHHEAATCRRAYYQAVAMEIVDGEMEILSAGEWRSFKPGTQNYPVRAVAATNLPPGKFTLEVGRERLRLEWRPNKPGEARVVVREATIL